MNPGYAFHPEAEKDFIEVWEYIASDSANAAERVADEITVRIESLARLPKSSGDGRCVLDGAKSGLT